MPARWRAIAGDPANPGGKAQYGGQRFGEMEVWAMEAYGAAYTVQELRRSNQTMFKAERVLREAHRQRGDSLEAGVPESFNVLVKEMQSLAWM